MSEAGHDQRDRGREGPVADVAGQPRISVVMANLNGEPYLERAMRSVLEQTHDNLELIVSDDGSRDGSLRMIRDAMARDPRVRLVESATATGPGAARNRALAMASGDWVAICDSDDIMHPERLARLLTAASALGADLVADDLIHFGEDPLERHGTLLQALALQEPLEVDALTLVTGALRGATDLSFGYLKPLLRRAALGNLRYNESLRIDEDYDLYLRLLVSGARFMVIPDAMYLYRRHPKSTSHRNSVASLERMVAAQAAFLRELPPDRRDLAHAVARRMKGHARELSYVRMLEALKAHRWLVAAGRLIRSPRNALSLLQSLKERASRRRLRQTVVKTQMNLVLCRKGRGTETDLPGFTRFEVPEIADTAWSPSAAGTWAELARLACEHDLHIVAADQSGEFALGLVPQFASARVRHTPHSATGAAEQARAPAAFFRSSPFPEEA